MKKKIAEVEESLRQLEAEYHRLIGYKQALIDIEDKKNKKSDTQTVRKQKRVSDGE